MPIFSTLTQREQEVFDTILDGYTKARQVAEILTIQRRTAEHHIASIRRKTGVRKAGLPRWAKDNLRK